jgi:hypothetical protein
MTAATGEPSEYGGYPGPIQPEPHKLTAAEQARLERRVDPADPGDSVDAARERERIGDVP